MNTLQLSVMTLLSGIRGVYPFLQEYSNRYPDLLQFVSHSNSGKPQRGNKRGNKNSISCRHVSTEQKRQIFCTGTISIGNNRRQMRKEIIRYCKKNSIDIKIENVKCHNKNTDAQFCMVSLCFQNITNNKDRKTKTEKVIKRLQKLFPAFSPTYNATISDHATIIGQTVILKFPSKRKDATCKAPIDDEESSLSSVLNNINALGVNETLSEGLMRTTRAVKDKFANILYAVNQLGVNETISEELRGII